MASITYEDFRLISHWKVDESESKFYDGTPKYIIDDHTSHRYFNENKWIVSFKCFLLSIATPLIHTVAAVFKIVFNLLKLISLYDFWKKIEINNKEDKNNSHIQMRCQDAGINILNICFAPIAIVLLEMAALYGLLFSAYDGRKLYASLERFTYGGPILAPCFQPEPEKHFFGGDTNQQNAF